MKKLLTTCTCALFSATALLADIAWLATVEAESIQSLRTGIEVFCKTAEIPVSPDDLSQFFSDLFEGALPLPSPTTAISFKDPVRVFICEDTDNPPEQSGEIFFLASLTLTADTKAIQDQLGQLYSARRDAGNVITFSTPTEPDSGIPPNILLTLADRNKALIAETKEILAWYQQQTKLDDILPPAGTQTLRLCLNIKRLASSIPAMPNDQPNPLALILGDLEYLSASITPNAQALTISYGARPKAGTVLASFLETLKPPAATLWNGAPENALFATLNGSYGDLAKFCEAYLKPFFAAEAFTQLAKQQAILTGENVSYLVPTKDKKALCFVQAATVKDPAAARAFIQTLDQTEASPGIKYKKEPAREAGQQTFERYSLVFDMNAMMQQAARQAGQDPNLAVPPIPPFGGNILAMFTKNIVFEYTVKDNYLVALISTADAIAAEMPTLPFPAGTVTLDKKIVQTDPTAKNLLNASELRIMPLLKQVITMLPAAKPQHLALFAAPTDPIQFWTTRNADNTTVITTRVPANEIAAISRLIMNGQTIMQEIFFSLFMNQMPIMAPPDNF